jgi:hypothetical protein
MRRVGRLVFIFCFSHFWPVFEPSTLTLGHENTLPKALSYNRLLILDIFRPCPCVCPRVDIQLLHTPHLQVSNVYVSRSPNSYAPYFEKT